MATISIKNVPDPLYQKLKERAKQGHRSVAQEIIHILDQTVEQEETLSIRGLRGLGKALWKSVDEAAYVREERDSWDS